jgi:non-specific serine/threonine protein kinase/serine/threonine-protein kinase
MPPDSGGGRPQNPASDSSLELDATIGTGDPRSGSVGVAGPIPSAPTGDLPRSIGRYLILGKLGEGGMGIVYEAEQHDPRRRVALKVVRGGKFVDESTIRMFRREAETLARLRHPNIGAIYESGRTEDGQHFFAMELVQGDNLDVFLSRRPKVMTPEEVRFRLALFRKIAEAVHYAHQRGVIHRDLKPSNIVISRESASDSSVTSVSGVRVPDIKILDFGLARITEGDVHVTQVTEVGVIKGTLPYMSPEQARGNADGIDVRTDVYALGVILYEMLASSKPYDVSRSSLIEAVRVICEEPPRSLRSSISGSRRLDPDIETIVGKALEKDADRRYASAAAMAEDLERYLASQPIMARPPSTVYQLRKFAGRNRALVAGVAATFVVLVAGVVVSSMQAIRATRAEALALSRTIRAESAEALALRRRHEAEQAMTLAEIRRAEAESQKAVAVKERSVAASQRHAAIASGKEAHLEAAKAGAINRFLQDMLATADPWAGDAGKVTLDAALERAQTRIGTWAGTDPEVDGAIRGTIATAFAGVGRFAEAESLLRGGIERMAGEPEPHPALVASLQRQLGGVLLQTAHYGQAEQAFRQALASQSLAGSPASDTAALIMGQVASALAFQGRYAQADTAARGAMDMARRFGGGMAAPSILRTQAFIEANGRDDFVAADSLLRQSVARLASRPGDHAVETSEAVEELAGNRVRMGDLAGADSLYRAAVAMRRRALGDNHPLVVRALESQGTFLYRTGHFDQTLDVLRQVLAIRQRGLGPESAPVGRTWVGLGPVYAQANRLPEAEAAYTAGIGILRKRLGDRHPDLAPALKDFADLRVRQGKLEDAEKLAREALSIRLERMGPRNPGTIASQLALADILRARRAKRLFPEAETLLLTARTAATSARGPNDSGAVRATRALVALYDAWGKPGESAKWRAALRPGQASPGSTSSR